MIKMLDSITYEHSRLRDKMNGEIYRAQLGNRSTDANLRGLGSNQVHCTNLIHLRKTLEYLLLTKKYF